jgi:type II secretory pathway component GspD/PulD (secretin)
VRTHRDTPWQGMLRLNLRPGWPLHRLMLVLSLVLLGCSGLVSAEAVTSTAAAPVDLVFQDTEIRSVFSVLADLAGVNVIFDSRITGTVTVSLRNVSVQEAINTVARVADVQAVMYDGLLEVMPKGEQKAVDAPKELLIRVYPLQYAEPDKVAQIVRSILPDLLVSEDDKAKRLVARGTAADLAELEAFLAIFDKAGQQVLIEARVQEVSRDALRELGLNWTLPAFTGTWDPVTGTLPFTMDNLSVVLDALENSGNGRLLARPHITAVSGEKATVFIGDRVPVILQGGAEGEDRIEYVEAGISLEIIARVGQDGMITTHVKPEVNSIASWTPQGMPQVRSRNAETTVSVRDGQPILIAGLIREEERNNFNSLAGLANVPVIGALFRNTRQELSQMETIIILTPRLVGEGGEDFSYLFGQNKGSGEQTGMINALQAKSQLGVTPQFSLGLNHMINNGTHLEATLSMREGVHALEIQVGAPLVSNPPNWRAGVAWRYGAAPLWIRLGADATFDNSITPSPTWAGKLFVGASLLGDNKLYIEPYVGGVLPIGDSTGMLAGVAGVAIGLRF